MQVSKNDFASGVSVSMALTASGVLSFVDTKLQVALACVVADKPTKPSIEINNAALIDLKPNMLSP
jgi:hypothetical protein